MLEICNIMIHSGIAHGALWLEEQKVYMREKSLCVKIRKIMLNVILNEML